MLLVRGGHTLSDQLEGLMLFGLLANICDLEVFSTYSGYPPSLGVVTVSNCPILLPHHTFVCIRIFPLPRKSEPLEITMVDSLADNLADSWYMFYFGTIVTH